MSTFWKLAYNILSASIVASLFATRALGEVTLDSVLSRLNSRYPLVLAAMQERPAAEAELLAAQGAFDGSIRSDIFQRPVGGYDYTRLQTSIEQPLLANGARIFGGYSVTDGLVPDYEGKLETNDGGELRAGVEIPILRDGEIDRRRANIQRAEAGRLAADAAVNLTVNDVFRSASIAYFEWVAAGLRTKIAESLLEAAVDRTRQLKIRASSGDLPEFDLLDNQRAELQRKAQVVFAERLFRKSSLDLSLFYRTEEGLPIELGRADLPRDFPQLAEPPPGDWESAAALAYERRPELRRIAAQRAQSEVELRLQKNQVLPRLDIQMASAKDFGDGTRKRADPELEFGVRIELPLQTRTADGRLAAAEAKLAELRILEKFTKQRIQNEVRDSLIGINLSRERVTLAQKETKTARSLEDGERARYESGDSNLIFVNLREQTAAEAAIREIDALLDYRRAEANYKAATAEFSASGSTPVDAPL